jgi:hypothetical protein
MLNKASGSESLHVGENIESRSYSFVILSRLRRDSLFDIQSTVFAGRRAKFIRRICDGSSSYRLQQVAVDFLLLKEILYPLEQRLLYLDLQVKITRLLAAHTVSAH